MRRVRADRSTVAPTKAPPDDEALRREDVQALHRRCVPSLRVGADVRGGGAQRRPRVAQGRPRRGAGCSRGLPRLGGHDRVQPRPGALPARRDDGGARDRSRARVHGPRRGRGGHRSHGLVRRLGRQARPDPRELEPRRRAILRLHGSRAHGGRGDPRACGASAPRARLARCYPPSRVGTRSSPSRRAHTR